MPALGFKFAVGLVVPGCELGLADGGGRFEADGEEDVGAVGDAALDAARVVGFGGQAGFVVVFVGVVGVVIVGIGIGIDIFWISVVGD